MKKLLIAYPVSDLTIARYLAAREIDFLALDLDSMDQLEANRLINQLRDWTEGPGIIGFTADEEKKGVFEFLRILDSVLLMNQPLNLYAGMIPNLTDHTLSSVHLLTDLTLLKSIQESDLKQTLATVSIDEENYPEQVLGWIFHPGKEITTGIYDFYLLEEFLDRLQEGN
ncbi:MAG: hypothetical protein WBP33_16985 [Saprospiraceae bacterium]|nr:hypothetical protein [Candidatus Vicinibacter proximus]HRG34390.1 hypothetical protein [Saprospiraceae bacterium]